MDGEKKSGVKGKKNGQIKRRQVTK
ncbi:hypothetical protein CCACVL1_30293, partial [Corchorus capsularis]